MKHICPHCNQTVSIPDDTEGAIAPCPLCSQQAKWADAKPPAPPAAHAPSRWSDEQKGYVIIAVVLLVLGVWYWNSGGVMCYPLNSNGWTFECQHSKTAAAQSDEQFPPHLIERIALQGDDLTRSFRGTRWLAIVRVESSKGDIVPGTYKMYGTVASIDGRRIQFRDCAFVK